MQPSVDMVAGDGSDPASLPLGLLLVGSYISDLCRNSYQWGCY